MDAARDDLTQGQPPGEKQDEALDRLVQNATLMGATAVVSMRFDSSELSGTMSEIVAYGTAVITEPEPGAPHALE